LLLLLVAFCAMLFFFEGSFLSFSFAKKTDRAVDDVQGGVKVCDGPLLLFSGGCEKP
jgi:hypothetical protein